MSHLNSYNPETGRRLNANMKASRWKRLFRGQPGPEKPSSPRTSVEQGDEKRARPEKWSLGVLNDKQTEEVPGECSCHKHQHRTATEMHIKNKS